MIARSVQTVRDEWDSKHGITMAEILVLEREADIYVARLREEFPDHVIHAARGEYEALSICRDAEVLVALAHEVSQKLASSMPQLRWIAALTTGTDHLETLKGLPADLIVTSGRGIHGPQMAELTFYYMIALSRNVRGMTENQKRRKWERWPQRLLLGKRAALVGVGAISEQIAVRCQAFGMNTIGVSDSRANARGFDRILPRSQLCEAAAEADFLIALVPYSIETHHLINESVLSAMKESAIFINVARGNVVDETALIRHLQDGKIAGAGLDVYAEEPPASDNALWSMDNVIMTPRVGGMSDIYAQQALPLMIENLRAYLGGRQHAMRNIVRNNPTERAS